MERQSVGRMYPPWNAVAHDSWWVVCSTYTLCWTRCISVLDRLRCITNKKLHDRYSSELTSVCDLTLNCWGDEIIGSHGSTCADPWPMWPIQNVTHMTNSSTTNRPIAWCERDRVLGSNWHACKVAFLSAINFLAAGMPNWLLLMGRVESIYATSKVQNFK